MNSDHFIKTATYDCLIGRLLLVKTAKGLLRVSFENENFAEILQDISLKYHTKITDTSNGFSDIFMQLDEYFSGKRQHFQVKLDHSLSKGFTLKVQSCLQNITYGNTASYKQIANNLHNPNASRAVGSACAKNPLPIFQPCHRVLKSDGSLGGFRGGIAAKKLLLALEGSYRI